ncbi:hypothetical protein CYMTET_48407 [Cymbomonas tetramitiformis]|uniref:Reverse transcriptase domain-containing protein n=1 Tax=Cymbomonas tetramitiformis TaxID=36881 RepID=A0AAE0BSC1_9CHLO|nr:hypothetical protein CYMTET_48407 [Cymbomonas tetramitiformis]
MESLKKLRRLAKKNDWCFSFDLQDGYHCVSMFDVLGELFQCSALPFGCNDSPRVFVKFMKVLVERLRSPAAPKDRAELRRLKSGTVRRRWEVRRHAGGAQQTVGPRGARVLPYMDDFHLLEDSEEEADELWYRVERVLNRLGLRRNEKKGQWEPAQVVEHLGLEIDFLKGEFRVTSARLQKIYSKAIDLLCETSRKKRWGAKVKLTRQAFGDLEWWKRLRDACKWNGRKIWRCPTRAKLHTDASLMAWGGVLNLKQEARGVWEDDLRHLHITHLELEAVFKTVQAFLRELRGKVVRLYYNNQAVVAMLAHFTIRNPDLMRRMRRLWTLLDLNDIELQARYIRSEANEWADRLSRDTDVDDWKLNQRWFDWAQAEWGESTVDRFASEFSAQLPRYYAQWCIHRLECRAPTAPEPEPGVGEQLEVFWPLDDAWYQGTVAEVSAAGRHHITYVDGEEEWLLLSEELTRGVDRQPAEDEPDDVVPMQEQALGAAPRSNYDPKAWRFRDFCVGEGREWLAAAEETVRFYIAALLEKGGIRATSMQPSLSAINNYHEDMGYPGPAKGRGVSRAVKGMARLQVAAAQERRRRQENVLADDDGATVILTRDEAWQRAKPEQTPPTGVPSSYWRLPGERVNSAGSDTDLANKWLALALSTVGCVPPEGEHFSAHSTRKGVITCARAVGVAMEKVCFLRGWSQLSSAVQAYIDPTTVADDAMRSYFGWVAPQGVCAQELR